MLFPLCRDRSRAGDSGTVRGRASLGRRRVRLERFGRTDRDDRCADGEFSYWNAEARRTNQQRLTERVPTTPAATASPGYPSFRSRGRTGLSSASLRGEEERQRCSARASDSLGRGQGEVGTSRRDQIAAARSTGRIVGCLQLPTEPPGRPFNAAVRQVLEYHSGELLASVPGTVKR